MSDSSQPRTVGFHTAHSQTTGAATALTIIGVTLLLAPGYFCLTAALRRAPSRFRLAVASLAPTLVLTYALAAIGYLTAIY